MAWGKCARLILNRGCSSVNEPPLTYVMDWLDWLRMKGIAWGVLWVLGSANLWAQPALEEKGPVVVNRVLAVVGGTRVITLHDIPPKSDDRESILAELINDVLLVQELRTRKGFVMPAGLGERLLSDHIRKLKQSQPDYSRATLVRELQRDGITLQQFEEQLVDQAFLRLARRPIFDSIQLSPRAISEFSKNGLKELGRGPYAEFLALQIPASEDGINETKVKALVEGIKSADDFKKLAEKRKVAGGGLRGRVYFDEKQKATWHIDAEVTATLYGIEAGKADYHQSDEIFHVMFVAERGEQEEPDLNDPRLRELIKGELSGRQYNARLQLKIQRLKREINVYRPGINK